MSNLIERDVYFYRNSGKGKNIALFNFSGSISLNKDNIVDFALLTSYKYLKIFCGYDHVYIVLNKLTEIDKDKITCELKEYKDDLISNVTNQNLLIDYNINDVIIHNPSENYFGGCVNHYLLFNVSLITKWWLNSKGTNNRLYVLQDDPEFFSTDPTKRLLDRLFVGKNLKVQRLSDENINKKIDDILLWMEQNINNIKYTFKNVSVAFCGIDYNEFYNNIISTKKPDNIQNWDKFESYIWLGVNYYLDEKFTDYPFENKKYDCVYCGTNKKPSRAKYTENFYKQLDNKFLHIYRKKPFFIKLQENEHYDSLQNVEFSKLYEVQCGNCKTSFVTHNPEVIGNQISPRYFDMMMGDIVALIDRKFDKDNTLILDDELKEFIYIDTPEEFSDKVNQISNDEKLYRKLVKKQRKAIFDKFREYIEEENLEKWNKIL